MNLVLNLNYNKHLKLLLSRDTLDLKFQERFLQLHIFQFNLIFSLIKFGKKSPVLGLILIKTFPYCGGISSSPPKTEIDSVSG
jgi:hypothetical protein